MSDSDAHVLSFASQHGGIEDGELRLCAVSGVEALSRPYQFELRLDSPTEGGISAEVVRELFKAPITIAFGGGGTIRYSGIPREIEMYPMSSVGRASYRMVLVPRFWATTRTRKSRVFNDMSIPDIVEKILKDGYGWQSGADYELRLSGSYAAREYVVQFEETDFDFINRWLEHCGIFYCFEQADDGDKIVFLDNNADTVAVSGFEELTYSEQAIHATRAGGFIGELSRINHSRPSSVHLRDYNWRKPEVVYGNHDIDADFGLGVQNYYGEHFKTNDDGDALARLRAEQWQTWSERFRAHSATPEIAAGRHFTLNGGPAPDLDRKYLVTRVIHRVSGSGEASYTNEIEMIDHAVQYRPPVTTPKPRIDGVMHAIIDGPEDTTEAPIDELGRYTVQLPFDVAPGETNKATRRIRMAQPSAGQEYGIHFPLHTGTEVILAHIGGDPDRPIIVGALPNDAKPTYIHSGRSTRSAIRSRSGIVIDLEDDA